MAQNFVPGRCTSIVALFLALPLITGTAHAEEGPRDRVEQLYRDGRAARERGDLAVAFELLSDAWARRKTHDVAASLAQVEYELGRVRDAAEHLAYACEHLPASADPTRVERLLTALEQIKRKLVTLNLVVEPNTAQVTLDGRPLGIALSLPKEVFADPGAITLTAELEGYARWETNLSTRAGDHKDIHVRLEKIERAGAKPKAAGGVPHVPARTDTDAPETTSRSGSGPFIVSATVTGVALTGAVTFWLVANSHEDHAERRLADIPGENRCGTGTPYVDTCKEVRSGLKSAKTFRALSYGAFGLSLAGATVSYLLWPKREEPAIALGTSFSPSSGWIGAEGQF